MQPQSAGEPREEHTFVPVITQAEIFEQLIADELKQGRLTPSRRKRLVRYATHLHLSALQVGQMITEARKEALDSDNPKEREIALRLAPPKEEKIPIAWKMAAVIGLAIVVDLVVVWLLS